MSSFFYANLSNTTLSGSCFFIHKFNNVLVSNIHSWNTFWESADLRNADLANANLREANLRNANLANADLTGADLRGAKTEDTKMEGAITNKARFQ